MIPMKKESKTICFNDFTQAVSYSNDTAVGLFVTSLERNGDGESPWGIDCNNAARPRRLPRNA